MWEWEWRYAAQWGGKPLISGWVITGSATRGLMEKEMGRLDSIQRVGMPLPQNAAGWFSG